MNRPPLAWLDGVAHSLGGAMGCSVSYTVESTVNPLVVNLRFRFGESVSGKKSLLIWNIFQKYATRNDCVPQGKTERGDKELLIAVGMKQRFGQPKNDHPLE